MQCYAANIETKTKKVSLFNSLFPFDEFVLLLVKSTSCVPISVSCDFIDYQVLGLTSLSTH